MDDTLDGANPRASTPQKDQDKVLADSDAYFEGLPPKMAELRDNVLRIAPQDTTILLTGETGTGKTRLARLIHSLSPRRAEPFLVVDCGALSPTLIESEMFGHIRGAFTGADRDREGKFAAAGRGTLLLDEVNTLPLALQGKLLRAVEDRVFEPVGSNREQPLHARIIAVSNASLDKEIEAGRFRADLYFRLNIISFYLPALRCRRSTIAPLCQRFMAEFGARNQSNGKEITPEALGALEAYDWPGNIRELRNVIERAIALCRGFSVDVADLPEAIRPPDAVQLPSLPVDFSQIHEDAGLTLTKSKEMAELRRIKQALHKHKNNRLRAADELGISRMCLYKKLHRYGLAPKRSVKVKRAAAD